MKKIKDKSKMYMILGISFLVLAVLGSTYAYYKYVIATINVDTITRGLDYYINYTKGTDITSAALNPGSDYTSGNNLSVTLYKKDNTYTIYGHIYLDISSISDGLSSSGALKYAVLEGTTKIADGELTGVASGNSVPLAVNIPLKTTSTKYTVYLWLDETEENYMSAENTSISATVRCEASMKPIKGTSYGTTGKYFYNKYTPNTKVINNSIAYDYDTTNNLMQDIGGNLRFYGASPNNYIYFNCSDYSNQSSSTCETWRIIGIFNGKLKLIRNEQIGIYSWGDDINGTLRNDWSDAGLMKLLNPGYESETIRGSLYYNSRSGKCFFKDYLDTDSDPIVSCDFTSTGIKNEATKNVIAETVYNLGASSALSGPGLAIFANQIYQYERGNDVYSGNSTIWKGKIAIPYMSDYGYAADFNLNKYINKVPLSEYEVFASNNWMKGIITSEGNNYGWLLNNFSDGYEEAWIVSDSGSAAMGRVLYGYGVSPVLYLNSDVSIASGSGTSSSPYKISIN